jgi:hypothetical protein
MLVAREEHRGDSGGTASLSSIEETLRELLGDKTIRLDSPGWIMRDVQN